MVKEWNTGSETILVSRWEKKERRNDNLQCVAETDKQHGPDGRGIPLMCCDSLTGYNALLVSQTLNQSDWNTLFPVGKGFHFFPLPPLSSPSLVPMFQFLFVPCLVGSAINLNLGSDTDTIILLTTQRPNCL